MSRLLELGFASVLAVSLANTATASGPKWTEMGDAGSLPGGAQATMGNGAMVGINGGLGMTLQAGEIDFEDMFLINIVDPKNFRVTTDPADPELMDLEAFANFNSQLWLFKPMLGDPMSLGFLGNDDHPDVPKSLLSLLIPVPTDGSPPLVDPGLYYIAISRFNIKEGVPNRNDPVSDGGEIFDQVLPFEISGPDGPGGMLPISGWTGDQGKFDGAYRIALQGVEFAESPCPWDLDNNNDVGVGDLLILLAAWGPNPGHPADFDGNDDVGVSDLLALLANWGPCS